MRLSQPGWDFGRRHDIGHVDIPRLREGGVDALFLAVWAPKPGAPGEGIREARQQLDVIRQSVQRFPGDLMLARTAADIERAHHAGRIAILIGIEGGYFIEDSLDALREFHALGATYMTLTHAWHTDWADSSGVHEPLEPRHHGLTDFGRAVICEMNRLGMMVDLSHASDETFWQAVELSKAPVILTHSSCRAVNPHRRNVTDEMMRAVADVGGVVQINFSATFVDADFPSFTPRPFEDIAKEALIRDPAPDHTTPLGKLADHFEHAISVIGPEHVGIGSDFDGAGHLPAGLEDCSRLPNLTAELLRRGIREDDLIKILGQNVLRVMRECAQVAEGLVSTRAKQ
ncbi:MAG: dipeptidase [Phycisphaerales bacterium]|nr:MAG: dipeptidase [Phycisphaerales bacterium]